ncbi:MAG: 4Fe-4S binding protein [Clostridium sp.]|uniref:4Fe-4S binding protein n=1 Tax=Clostridium saudiense TaxID=1414720 RepID=A0ABS2FG35_9CLOT|nr:MULTISPECIES: 4Fe-4S binding protein [Clostridiaceae]MBM6819525.1 4Fe-4S binding protein [Clostridium saudiense]MBQ8999963.1 4Fe-4S binding protein [Clostridium sp.]
MPRVIDKFKCISCGNCERVCKVGCISQLENKKRIINPSACVDCGACQLACPKKCISQN